MKDLINEKLKEIEKREKIKILHCVESGSRAWGFASPDSDYDVRFIYLREKEFYLRLEDTRDVIEWQLDDTLDINGWDVKKALALLYKSNPTLFEWNLSPIVYKTTDEWQEISKIINEYFVQKSGVYHYLSTAKSNYREYLKGEIVRCKKYFYVLRPLLACKWILDKKSPPPMLFETLVKEYLSGEVLQEVNKLIDLKKSLSEVGLTKKIHVLNDYIDKTIVEIENALNDINYDRNSGWEKLNGIFLSLVEKGI